MMKERQSEPTRLGLILPSVMSEIRERMETKPEPTLFADEHKAGVFSAVGGFMSDKKRRQTLCVR